jgi:hypothetical protein
MRVGRLRGVLLVIVGRIFRVVDGGVVGEVE